MIQPGDIVVFNKEDPEVSAKIIETFRPPTPTPGFLQTQDETLRLQALWRVNREIRSHNIYIVVCTGAVRAMVFSNKGRLLVTETRFLDKLNKEDNQC